MQRAPQGENTLVGLGLWTIGWVRVMGFGSGLGREKTLPLFRALGQECESYAHLGRVRFRVEVRFRVSVRVRIRVRVKS